MSGLAPFAARLLSWWEAHGRHDLPWQHPRTPYRVWVSEIMLQQTQVATVIPYFERWMERFPDLPALARAELDEVLAHWAGLGYYARARNLHGAAQKCVEEFGGRLPKSPDGLSRLPGIGASTANAIVSQAHDVPLAVLDGNARRVLARHAAVEGWPGEHAVQKRLWQEAVLRLPGRRGADYTQAIMDLGATVCTRTRARCADCPVGSDCRALQQKRVDSLPSPRPKLKVREKNLFMLILWRPGGEVLLERRPLAGIWGGLWSLPAAEDRAPLLHRFGLGDADVGVLPGFEHRLTHLRLRIRPLTAGPGPGGGKIEYGDGLEWFAPDQWPALGVPRPVSRLLSDRTEAELA